jgi:hypothetical protein
VKRGLRPSPSRLSLALVAGHHLLPLVLDVGLKSGPIGSHVDDPMSLHDTLTGSIALSDHKYPLTRSELQLPRQGADGAVWIDAIEVTG